MVEDLYAIRSGYGVDGLLAGCNPVITEFDSLRNLDTNERGPMEGFDFQTSDDENDAIAQYIEYLIDNEGFVLDGITEEGEAIYLYNMEVLERIAPEFAADHLKSISDSVISLYEKGLVEMEITDEGDVLYRAVDKSDWVQPSTTQEEASD